MALNLAAIPPQAAFLDMLAQRWLAQHADAARGLILLPTRRAARALAEAFLRAGDGRPMLLPRIIALGALDEMPLTLAGALDLPPAIEAAPRLAALSRLILALPADQGGAVGLDGAWRLAQDLAALMDEAERAEVPLREALRDATGGQYAEHWQITLQFLRIVTDLWPAVLEEQGLMNPARQQAALLGAQARAWQEAAPDHPVWAAGMTGATPAVVRLLGVIAGLPQGLVLLPGLDAAMPEAVWNAIGPTHPQAGLKRLLAGMGAAWEEVEVWPAEPSARPGLLAQALLPAEALGAWRALAAPDISGMSRLSPADQQEEAAAIALVLRDALEVPGARAALITPDRALAGRVAVELRRWGVVADDSAGEPLAETPPAVFLRLLATALAEELAPVALLGLLKHPLAAAGLTTADCRAAARALERACLRGPKPPGGLTGLRRITSDKPELARFVDRLEVCLEPALRTGASRLAAPADLLAGLVAAGEALAATDARAGPARLWAQEEGEALASILAAALPALADLPDQAPKVLPGLLDALLTGEVVRSRRALRASAGEGAEHPRVFIWGLLEARLQSVEVAVLGGLAEGVWPQTTDPGPWMSRPMRREAGLPDPEEAIGQSAHDFTAAACAAGTVVLSCPRRRDGAPAVPARWLVRLEALLKGAGCRLPEHPAAAWAAALDRPAGAPRPVAAPQPRPALHLRPRKLSVTEIETWIADPYAIHARHILRLRALDPLEQATDAADYGSVVHEGLHQFFAAHGTKWPEDAHLGLRTAMDAALLRKGLRPALREWWRPRLHRIADWVAETQAGRAPPAALATELSGTWVLADVPRGFTLTGRADRIERRADGRIAILDYKTGAPPPAGAVADLSAPQLPLEAAMAQAGAFGAAFQAAAAELTYWQLSGGFEAGVVKPTFKGDPAATEAAAAEAEAKLRARIAAFDDPATAYLARPYPAFAPRFGDYAQLARIAEWDLAGEGEDE